MTTYPILNLAPKWGASADVSLNHTSTVLGDVYQQFSYSGIVIGETFDSPFSFSAVMPDEEKVNLEALLNFWSGVQRFYWSPDPTKIGRQLYVCTTWSFAEIADEQWMFTGTFTTVGDSPGAVEFSSVDDLIADSGLGNLLEGWAIAGYRGGEELPVSGSNYAWELPLSSSALWGANAIAANTFTDQSVKLQNIIDSLNTLYPSKSYARLLKIVLPAGIILCRNQIFLHADFTVLSGAGSDPATGSVIRFRPNLDTRYDVSLSADDVSEADAFDLGLMEYGEVNGGMRFPGRAAVNIHPIEVHPDYAAEFAAAPANRKDFYLGSINFPWKSGRKVSQVSPFAARKGGRSITLISALGLYAGQWVIVYACNTRNFYNSTNSVIPARQREVPIVRTKIHQIESIQQNTLRLSEGLEFDVPANQESDGAVISETQNNSYFSQVLPLRPVRGVGVENFYIHQPMDGEPAVGGGEYNLTPAAANYNYTNLAAEYALHGVAMKWAINCWAKGIRTYYTGSHAIVTEFVRHCQIENCIFQGSWNKGAGGNGYVRGSKMWHSLIKGNQISELRHITLQWSASYNVVKDNVVSCDMNLHGGWERYNLMENNIINIPFEHRFGTPSPTTPAAGAVWFPLWWGAAPHASRWSSATGAQNVVFNNVLTKQITPGGAYDPYVPYERRNTLYVFGTDSSGFVGEGWTHLTQNGIIIPQWGNRELVDFSLLPNTGVNASGSYAGRSLHSLARSRVILGTQLLEFTSPLGYNPASITGYTLHFSGQSSSFELTGSEVSAIRDLTVNRNDSVPQPSQRPSVGSLGASQVLSFGSGDILDVPVLGGRSLSIVMLIQCPAAASAAQWVMAIQHSNHTWALQVHNDGSNWNRLRLGLFENGSLYSNISTSAGEFPPGQWRTVSLTIDDVSNAYSFWVYGNTYRNKVEVGATFDSAVFTAGLIGANPGAVGGSFTGGLAEMIVYNKVLTEIEQFSLMEHLIAKYGI